MKKLVRASTCIALALCLICSIFTVTAGAATAGSDVSNNPLYDDDSYWNGYDPDSDPDDIGSYSICFIADKTYFGDFTKMYCYIYDLTPHTEEGISYEPIDGNGRSLSTWGGNQCVMEPSGKQAAVSVESFTTAGEIWYLDLYDRDIRLNPDDTYLCIFTADWQAQTCDMIVGTPSMGMSHVAYLTGDIKENPVDSNKHTYTVSWSNVDASKYAQPLTITSIGNVTGTAYAKGQTPYSKFLAFVSSTGKDGLRNALSFNNKTSQQTIDDIATNPAINLSKSEIQKAIDEANAIIRETEPDAEPIAWDASLSPARDDTPDPSGFPYPTPEFSNIESTSDGVKLSWDRINGVYGYRVFYKNKKGGWTALGTTVSDNFTDTDVRDGATYTYTLRCVDTDGSYISDYNHDGVAFTYVSPVPSVPQIAKLENTADGVKLSWNPVGNADKYRVFYKNKKGNWVKLGDTADTTFTDTIVSDGVTYTYTLRCLDSNGAYSSSYYSKGWNHTYKKVTLDTPEVTSLSSTSQGVNLAWNEVAGATAYRVFYKNKNGGWTKLGDTSSTFFVDTVVSSGTSYTYTVRCLNSAGRYCSSYDPNGSTITYDSGISAPKVTKLESTSSGVKLTWNRESGVNAYRVFYKNKKGSWTKLGDTASDTFTDTDVHVGGTYTYTVRALNSSGRYCSGYNSTGYTHTYNP